MPTDGKKVKSSKGNGENANLKAKGATTSAAADPTTRRPSEEDEDEDDNDDDDDEQETPYCDPPVGYVRMRPSEFKNLPATVFFEYPPELGMKRSDLSRLDELKNRKLCYTSFWDRICIRNAFLRAGFKVSDTNWTGNCICITKKNCKWYLPSV